MLDEKPVSALRSGTPEHGDPPGCLQVVDHCCRGRGGDGLTGASSPVVTQGPGKVTQAQRDVLLLCEGEDGVGTQLTWCEVLACRDWKPHEAFRTLQCAHAASCCGAVSTRKRTPGIFRKLHYPIRSGPTQVADAPFH
ncbi:hypothetical protein [Streptomyces sp. NPDC040750]|uniref:hypothetical protein n=1 Tax=Streptomyces sp. NPDC040750 TaxID=3154491 RepID=UPI0033E0788C